MIVPETIAADGSCCGGTWAEAKRLVAFVVPENVPSARVAEKLGFVSDGGAEREAATGEQSHDRLR